MTTHTANLPPRASAPERTPVEGHSKKANWALGLAIAGFVIPFAQIVGLVMAIQAHRRDKQAGRPYGRAKAAWIIVAATWALSIPIAIAIAVGSGGGEAVTVTPTPAAAIEKAAAPSPTPAPKAAPAPAPAPAPTPEPVETVSQQNAVESAASYLDMSGFSRKGLIDQLKFEGYSTADATYGVDAQGASWNAEAAESARSYLDMSSFSRQGLIDQLEFEGFTTSQATYGVTQAGF